MADGEKPNLGGITQKLTTAPNGLPARLTAHRLTDLMNAPSPVAIVQDFAWAGGITMLVAEPGLGKTFVLLDLAAAVSEGQRWHGRRVRQGSVLYVSFESDAIGKRSRGLRETGRNASFVHWERAHAPLASVHGWEETPAPGAQALAALLADVVEEIRTAQDPPLRLLIIDPFRDSLGGSEDRSEDVANYFRAVRRLAAPHPEMAVVIAHHAGWQDGDQKRKRERGSSALRATVEATVYGEVVSEDFELAQAILALRTVKVRDGQKPHPLSLVRSSIILPEIDPETGDPETTCVITTDLRTREEIEARRVQALAEIDRALDDRACDVIAQGHITAVEQLRATLGVSMPVMRTCLARIIQGGRVTPPYQKRAVYRVMGQGGGPE